MPEICRFFGIIVAMHYNDHPPPHFHVRYGDQKALVAIREPRVLRGSLTPRALGLVMEWAALRQDELMRDWLLAEIDEPLNAIAPLE
jgi:hypothetical protein